MRTIVAGALEVELHAAPCAGRRALDVALEAGGADRSPISQESRATPTPTYNERPRLRRAIFLTLFPL